MDKYYSANAILSVFSKNYMELKKNLPIRPSEMGVLNIITETQGPHTPLMLARMLNVSKPMITAHITSLAENDYIEKEASETDKRGYYIKPTSKAIELVKAVRKTMQEQLDYLMEGMGQEDLDSFVRLAEKANQILKAKENI